MGFRFVAINEYCTITLTLLIESALAFLPDDVVAISFSSQQTSFIRIELIEIMKSFNF